MKISQLVAQHMAVLPIGCVLMPDQVERSLRDAVRQYAGYADLKCGTEIDESANADPDSQQDLDLTTSEMSIVGPLWRLYMEKENSMALEASRTQGAELFGRAVAEVQASIESYETRLPQLAFSSDIVSI